MGTYALRRKGVDSGKACHTYRATNTSRARDMLQTGPPKKRDLASITRRSTLLVRFTRPRRPSRFRQGEESRVLDMVMAPRVSLECPLYTNPTVTAVGIVLPAGNGGHIVMVPRARRADMRFTNVTMLAEDLGIMIEDIPKVILIQAGFLLGNWTPIIDSA